MPKKLYALVKWIDGSEKDTYTPDVPVEWIIGFDVEKFYEEENDDDETYVIEWHDTKDRPTDGWKCYDGVVVEVSSRKNKLEKKLKEINGQLSPNRIRSSKFKSKRKKTQRNIDLKRSSGSISSLLHDNQSANQLTDSNRTHRTRISTSTSLPLSKTQNVVPTDPEPTTYSQDILKVIQNQNDILSKVSKRIEELETCSGLSRQVPGRINSSFVSSLTPPEHTYARPISTDKFEIGLPGSGIYITLDQWYSAKNKTTYTAAARSLVMAVFEIDILLKSNVNGGKSKISKTEVKHTALEPKKLQAIRHTVREKWKSSFKETIFNASINSKLCELRRLKKIRENYEVEDSSDED